MAVRPTLAGARMAVREPQDELVRPPPIGPAPAPDEPTSMPSVLPGSAELSISTVAHELRAPLTSLATASELLIEDLELLDPQQIRDMLSVIRQGTLWLLGMVENILCAATVRAGRFQIQPQSVRIIDVVAEVQPVVEPLLVQKAQRLQVSSRGLLPQVAADRRWIGHVLVNLIANASKFSGTGKSIGLRLTTRGDYLRVMVVDRGPGLAAGSTEKIFEPFHRGAEAAQSGAEGVGLGLAIVKSIVEAHGGRVGAENRPAGGACVWFELAALPAASLLEECS
jgi:two-component system sensor histidine kinase KdpD